MPTRVAQAGIPVSAAGQRILLPTPETRQRAGRRRRRQPGRRRMMMPLPPTAAVRFAGAGRRWRRRYRGNRGRHCAQLGVWPPETHLVSARRRHHQTHRYFVTDLRRGLAVVNLPVWGFRRGLAFVLPLQGLPFVHIFHLRGWPPSSTRRRRLCRPVARSGHPARARLVR